MGGRLRIWTSRAEIPNVRGITGKSVRTSNLRAASFRGFGNPQVSFARRACSTLRPRDRHRPDRIPPPQRLEGRQHLRHQPEEIRGGKYGIGFLQTLDQLEDPRFSGKTAEGASQVLPSPRRRPCQRHAWLGLRLPRRCRHLRRDDAKLNPDGTFVLYVRMSRHRSGGTTISLIQITAEAMGVEPDKIMLATQNTDTVPFDNGTSAGLAQRLHQWKRRVECCANAAQAHSDAGGQDVSTSTRTS